MIVRKSTYVSPNVEVMNARVERGFLGNSDSQPSPAVDGDFTSGAITGESMQNGGSHGNEIFT